MLTMDLAQSMLWFWTAYVVVTAVGIGHTVFNWKILKMTDEGIRVLSVYDISSYRATLPWHPFYNIVLFPVAASAYFAIVRPDDVWAHAWTLAFTWALVAIVVDVIGWVLIRHPWSMTWHGMYVEYQPWLTLIYAAIFVAPLIAGAFMQ